MTLLHILGDRKEFSSLRAKYPVGNKERYKPFEAKVEFFDLTGSHFC